MRSDFRDMLWHKLSRNTLLLRQGASLHALACIVALFALMLHASVPPVLAQSSAGGWTQPQQISDSAMWYSYSRIATDDGGCVHVVWSGNSAPEVKDQYDMIFYTARCGSFWSQPVNTLAVPQESRLDLQSLTTDRAGRLLLLWLADRELQLSVADLSLAGSPHGWSTTDVLPGARVSEATMVADDHGRLHALAVGEDQELQYLYRDEGEVWYGPVLVAATYDGDMAFATPALAVKGSVVCAAWNVHEASNDWGPTALWFARSTDGEGAVWTSHDVMASGAGNGPGSLVFDHEDRLHLFWVGSLALEGRYHRWSGDGGATWTDTVNLAPDLKGLTGGGSPLVDSGGVLHVIFGGLGADGEGVRYARWEDGDWSRQVNISGNLPLSEGGTGVISEGHILHAVWPDLQQGVIYYAERDTGSPPVEVVARATPTPLASTPRRTVTPVSEAPPPNGSSTPLPFEGDSETQADASGPFVHPAAMGGGAALLCVLVMVLLKARRSR